MTPSDMAAVSWAIEQKRVTKETFKEKQIIYQDQILAEWMTVIIQHAPFFERARKGTTHPPEKFQK